MSKQISKPLALAVGAALVGGAALSSSAFAMTDLAGGYMVSASHAGAEASCGADKKAEGSCGGDKAKAEGKCGEGKCGVDKMDTDKDGKVSSAEFGAAHGGDTSKFAMHDTDKDGFISAEEMKAHMEGKCGGDKAKAEGDKAKMEGKCGEGKCGGSM